MPIDVLVRDSVGIGTDLHGKKPSFPRDLPPRSGLRAAHPGSALALPPAEALTATATGSHEVWSPRAEGVSTRQTSQQPQNTWAKNKGALFVPF